MSMRFINGDLAVPGIAASFRSERDAILVNLP